VTSRPAGNADTAAEFLGMSAEGADTLAAVQGIGYALLAVVDQLADANEGATETRDQLFEIAMAIDGPARELRGSRMPGAFGRLAHRARPGRARKAGVAGLLSGISGPGKNAAMLRYADQWLREHPGGVVSVHDLKDVSGDVVADAHARQDVAGDVPGAAHAGQVVLLDVLRRSRDVVVLDGADVVTVRQALADAAVWRAWKAEGASCADCARLDPGRCAGHAADHDQFAAYEALRDRMAGGAL